jgi:hypothetical protein
MINLFCFFNSKFFLREESKRNRRFLFKGGIIREPTVPLREESKT